MHRRQDVVATGIPQVIFRQVVAPDRIVRPQEEMGFRSVGQERVTVRLQVPKMMMSVDKRDGSRRFAPLATDRLHFRSSARLCQTEQLPANQSSDWPCGPVQAFGSPSTAKRNFPRGIGVGARAAMSGKTDGTSLLIQTARDRRTESDKAQAGLERAHIGQHRRMEDDERGIGGRLGHQGRQVSRKIAAHDAWRLATRRRQGSPQVAAALILFRPDQGIPARPRPHRM